MNFEGTYVAMVTPFTKEGTLDEEGFRSNINYLIEQGVDYDLIIKRDALKDASLF